MRDEVEQDVDEQSSEPKTRGGLLILAVAGLLGIGVGGSLGGLLVGPMVGARMATATADGAAEAGSGGHGGEGEESSGGIHLIDNMVVNPAESNGTRFLLITVAADLGDFNDPEVLGDRDFAIRDAILQLLGSKTVAELSDISQRPQLISQIKDALDRVLGPNTVRRLFIPQFVIQ